MLVVAHADTTDGAQRIRVLAEIRAARHGAIAPALVERAAATSAALEALVSTLAGKLALVHRRWRAPLEAGRANGQRPRDKLVAPRIPANHRSCTRTA